MAKKTKVQIDIEVNGKMQKATVAAKDLRKALDGIDKSNKKAAKSAGTLDRNMKGASSASANMTKNFSKMAQGGGGIAAIYAQIAAQVFAVSAAFQFLKSSADVSKLIKGQEALGAVTGTAYKTLTRDLQAATGGQLAYAEAAQAAAIGSAAGLSSGQLEDLGKAARNASAALGRDLTDSFNRLIRGVTKAEPELLDELGIILRLEDATRDYALSVGKSAGDLSTFERSQAVVNNVLGQAEDKFGKIAKIMDPGAESLNRFLTSFDELLIQIKTGVIDALRPVFDFLANNTSALVTAFAALAAIIVKSLIPNFGQYAKSATAASFGVKRLIVAQRKEFEALAEAARLASLSIAERTAEIAANFTKSTGLQGSEGGLGAVDFLSGATDDGRAANAAKRAIENQEQQFEDSVDRRTGRFADFTEEQVRLARASYDERIALLAKEEAANLTTTEKMRGAWDKLWLRIKLGATNTGAFLLKWGARIAGALQVILIVGAFAGAAIAIVSILADIAKAIYNFFFPISEESKKASDEVDKLTKKFESLNEEMERMVRVRKEIGLSLTERITQAGGAAQSADLANKAIDLQRSSRMLGEGLIDQEEYDAAESGFIKLFKANEELIPGLKGTQDAFLNTKDPLQINIDKLNEVAEAAINAKVAQEDLTRTQKTLQQQIASFTGGKVDPIRAIVATARKGVGQRNTQISQAEKDLATEGPQNEAALEAARQRLAGIQATDAARFTGDGFFAGGMATRRARKSDAIKKTQEEIEKLEKSLETNNAQYQALLDKRAKEQAFLTALEKMQTTYNSNVEKAEGIRERVAKNMRIEFDISDKINNLGLKREAIGASELDMANKVLLAKTAMENATAEEKDTLTDSYNALVSQQTILEANNNLKRDQLDLELRIAEIQKDNDIDGLKNKESLLSLEQQVLGMVEKQAAAQKTINDLAQQRVQRESQLGITNAKLNSDLPGFIFNEQQKVEEARIEAERKINKLKLDQIDRDKEMATAKLSLEKAQFEIAQARLRMELMVLNEKNNAYVIPAGPDAGLTGDQSRLLGTINTNANSAFADQETAIAETHTAAGEAIAASNRELDLSEQKLTEIGQLSQALGSTLESSMTSAFSSIITGTSSVKDAFGNMALAILDALAQVIAKLLVVKLIESTLGSLSFGGGGSANPTNFSSIDEFFRYGGVTKKAKGYATGGIANGPQAGYPVMMHGREAIVPLPNGNSIPVEMRGGGSQQNNVTVNVSTDGRAQSSSDGTMGDNLGQVIAAAVQKELHNQKRAGGILNKHGAA